MQTRALVSRVLGYLRPHQARLGAGLGLTLAEIALGLLKPVPLAIVLDSVLSGKPLPAWLQPLLGGLAPPALLAAAASGIVLVAVALGCATVGANYFTIDVGGRMVGDLRTELFSHLQKLSLSFHYRQQTGDLLFRVMADTYSIQGMVMNGMLPLLSSGLMLLGMLAVMLQIDVQLALVSVAVAPLLYLAIARITSRIHGQASESREAESELYARTETAIGAVKLVQAYGREERAVDDFRRGSDRHLRASLRLYGTETLFILVVDSVLALGTALLVYLGARHVLEGRLGIGTLTIFLAYLKDMYTPIQSLAHNLKELSSSRAGLDRVFSVLDVQPEIRDRPGARPVSSARGEIAFEAVTFGYEADRPVLRGVSLRLQAGERIALVGRTGAGKSTLASLVMRFFDPQQGRVTLDGCDLRDLTLSSLRAQIALMLQEPVLFPSSISDNLTLGVACPAEKVRAAARRAQAEGFILELPQGYDTVLGQDGLTLSGGQRQRLGLARALLRETPIVILDEPTSSLDVTTEALVWRDVAELLRGRTALIIAHRLSTARLADRIAVLGDGTVQELGSHGQLIARGGGYARMWQRATTGDEETDQVLAEAEP